MIRKLKALGLAVAVLFAMSAAVASAASAQQGKLTSDGAPNLTGSESPATLTAFSGKVVCAAHYDAGDINDTPETPHGFMTLPTTTVTLMAVYTGCTHHIGETRAPATITMNGCDFVVHIGTTLEVGKYRTTTDIVCPSGPNQIEVHAYSNTTHGLTICTTKYAAQTGLTGGFIKNVTNGDLTLGGPITGIHATKTGILCGGSATTTESVLDIDAVISGSSQGGGATDLSITD